MIRFVDERGTAVMFEPDVFVIAGYTGRDRAAVRVHIDELARAGIAPPPEVPMWYEMPCALLTTADRIEVPTAQTSGEVEPVLICMDDALYLGIGSDHTARDVERDDVARSKRICPKPIGRDIVRVEKLDERFDGLHLESAIDGVAYQSGSLDRIVPLGELYAGMRGRTASKRFVLYCGTVPLLTHTFRFGRNFFATIWGDALVRPLTLAYDLAGASAPPERTGHGETRA